MIKRAGGWRNDKVVEGYIQSSHREKRKAALAGGGEKRIKAQHAKVGSRGARLQLRCLSAVFEL